MNQPYPHGPLYYPISILHHSNARKQLASPLYHLTHHTCPPTHTRTSHISSHTSSIKCYVRSISADLEIECLIEIGVKVCFHSQRKKSLILGAWVVCARKCEIVLLSYTLVGESLAKTLGRACPHDRWVINTPTHRQEGRPGQANRCPVPKPTLAYAYGVSDEQPMESLRAELLIPRVAQSASR
jgi:hypothetical protein